MCVSRNQTYSSLLIGITVLANFPKPVVMPYTTGKKDSIQLEAGHFFFKSIKIIITQRGKDTCFFFYDAVYDFPGFLHLLFRSWGELGKHWSERSPWKMSACGKKGQRTSVPPPYLDFVVSLAQVDQVLRGQAVPI